MTPLCAACGKRARAEDDPLCAVCRADEDQWDAQFAQSQDVLAVLADEVRVVEEEGET